MGRGVIEVLMHLSMPQLVKGFGISTEQRYVFSINRAISSMVLSLEFAT
jgi:hypothetical protein